MKLAKQRGIDDAREDNETYLHSSTEAKHQVKSRLLLNVVVGEGTSILQLLAGKDETLLVRWNSLLVLNLGLHGLDGIRGLDLQGNGLSSEGLDEYLHDGCFSTQLMTQQARSMLLYFWCLDKT